jgi:hypothetical protein
MIEYQRCIEMSLEMIILVASGVLLLIGWRLWRDI